MKKRTRQLRFKTYTMFVDFYKRMKERIKTLFLKWSDVKRGYYLITY